MTSRGWILPLLLALLPRLDVSAMSWPPGSSTPDKPFIPPSAAMADRLVVKKAERRLYLMRGGHPIRSFEIALGFAPTGHKGREGDGRTPEGRYLLDWKNPHSKFRKSLHLSYPNTRDRMRARFRNQPAGGMIMIHGQPNGRREPSPIEGDWTLGCIAVSNDAIDEIWMLTASGTPIEVLP